MAQFNLSLDKIIHPTRDPSRPMPWWDKSRLYLHGRLTFQIQQAQIIYHVSMDPYNRTEEMKWLWTQLFFDWTNAQMLFKGCLDIYLNTESKYDDCRLLHLPNLELKINIDWICKNSNTQSNFLPSNAHNQVIPCAPEKKPIIINSAEHDSFALFRSENINVSFSFICTPDSLAKDVPICIFYASTSRFIERIKNLLSGITRPTRRGKLFSNLKPKKPILSRHFKITNFYVDIPKLNIIYWSSASQEYGVQFECEHFKLNSTHKLDLIPFIDNLKRRPKPCWSVEIMKFTLAQTNIFLLAPGNLNKTGLNQTSTPTTVSTANSLHLASEMKSFFVQVDSIFYEREKNSSYDFLNSKNDSHKENRSSFLNNSFLLNDQSTLTLKNQSITSLMPFRVINMPKHNVRFKNLKAKWNNINRDVIYILYEIYNKANRLRHNLSSQALKQHDMLTDQIIQKYADEQSQYYLGLSRNSSVSSNEQRPSTLKSPMRNDHLGENDVYFEELFAKLVADRAVNSNAYCDDKMNSDASNYIEMLYGVHAATKMSDVVNENIYIEFINSQVKLSLEDTGVNFNKPNLNETGSTKSGNKKQKSQPSVERQV